MAVVRFKFTSPVSGDYTPVVGDMWFEPTARRVIVGDPDNIVLPIPFSASLVNGTLDVDLAQTGPDWVWKVTERIHGRPTTSYHVAVPSGAGPIDAPELVQVNPGNYTPIDTTKNVSIANLDARLDAIETGGASVPDAAPTIKGKLALAGDLGGTADAPTVPGLAAKLNTSSVDSSVAAKVTDMASSTRAALNAAFSTVVNAKDPRYGIAGDGTTDDTAAIQALINGIGPNTVLHFPAGVYRHDHLTFTGKSDFALVGDGAVFVAATRTDRYIRFLNCSDFTVRGITSKGATATVRSGPTRGLSIEGCQRARILGNRVYNTEGVGIYVGKDGGTAACTDVEVADNHISDTFADGIHVTGGSQRVTLTGNQVLRSGDDSYAVVSYNTDAAGCEDVTISGNISVNSKSRGVAVVGGKGVSVSGNTINAPKHAGVYIAYEGSYGIRAVSGVTVTGNTIRAANTYDSPTTSYAAIHVVGDGGTTTPVEGVTITGNTIDGGAYHGILAGSAAAGCYGFMISNNNVRNSGSSAVFVQAVTNISVTGNMLDTSNESGLSLSGTLGVATVVGNTIKDPNRTSVATSKRGLWVGCPSITRAILTANNIYDSTGASNNLLDFSTTPAGVLMDFGNYSGQNPINAPAGNLPFRVPGNILLNGALETSGLGGGAGVTGIRNAGTAPSSNPASGGILYAEGGAARWRTTGGTVSTMGGDVTAVSAAYTALASDRTILATGGASGITITLPAATKGAAYEIIKVDSGAGAITVGTTGSQTINGAATQTIAAQYGRLAVVSNGTSWFIATPTPHTHNASDVNTGVLAVARLGSGTPGAGKYVDGGTGAWTTLPAGGGGGLSGTGSPEGVVTASVGATYTDTAATNGAITWIKATGTGNTGWKVTYGDTGWRLVLNAVGGFTCHLRRIGDAVYIQILITGNTAVEQAMTLPAGFVFKTSIATRIQMVGGRYGLDGAPVAVWLETVKIGTKSTGANDLRVAHCYATDDAWPSTLPGTPA